MNASRAPSSLGRHPQLPPDRLPQSPVVGVSGRQLSRRRGRPTPQVFGGVRGSEFLARPYTGQRDGGIGEYMRPTPKRGVQERRLLVIPRSTPWGKLPDSILLGRIGARTRLGALNLCGHALASIPTYASGHGRRVGSARTAGPVRASGPASSNVLALVATRRKPSPSGQLARVTSTGPIPTRGAGSHRFDGRGQPSR